MSNRTEQAYTTIGGLMSLGGLGYLIDQFRNIGGGVPGAKWGSGASTGFDPHPDFTPTKPTPEIVHEPIPEPSMLDRIGQWWDETVYEAQRWLVEKALEYSDTINAIVDFFSW
ncbi:TPA: hypothetical protein I7716_21240 [Vibrio vulnificus]|nr:hypothetical protein [Vibrio vulnificus]